MFQFKIEFLFIANLIIYSIVNTIYNFNLYLLVSVHIRSSFGNHWIRPSSSSSYTHLSQLTLHAAIFDLHISVKISARHMMSSAHMFGWYFECQFQTFSTQTLPVPVSTVASIKRFSVYVHILTSGVTHLG